MVNLSKVSLLPRWSWIMEWRQRISPKIITWNQIQYQDMMMSQPRACLSWNNNLKSAKRKAIQSLTSTVILVLHSNTRCTQSAPYPPCFCWFDRRVLWWTKCFNDRLSVQATCLARWPPPANNRLRRGDVTKHDAPGGKTIVTVLPEQKHPAAPTPRRITFSLVTAHFVCPRAASHR